jgi:hypothetical protein
MQYCELEACRMRIDKHEDSRIQGRMGATAAIGGLSCFGRLPSANRCRVFECSSPFGMPLDESYRRGGDGALEGHDPSGRPRKLTRARERQVLGWFRRSPTRFGFPTERWTAARVAKVIYRKWRIIDPQISNATRAPNGSPVLRRKRQIAVALLY